MRALLLTSDYVPGNWSGIGTAVATQAAALAARGVHVEVIVPAHHGAASAPLRSGPPVRPLTRRCCPVRPHDFDLVHLHSLALSDLAFQIRSRFGLPVVTTSHSLLHREIAGVEGAQSWIDVQASVMRRSDHVLFLSASERAAALERDPSLAVRTSVQPNGLPRPPSLEPPEPQSPGPVVFAGRFALTKGIDLVGAIVRRLAGCRDVTFVLAGGHGDAAGAAVVDELASLAPPPHCRVVGWLGRRRLDALFASASVVLVPSRYEPFGMVAVEAMRMGAPVLASDEGALSEIVAPSSGGRLMRSPDPEDWCDAILDLVRSPESSRALRRRGPAHVARCYDADTLAAQLVETVYGRLVDERPFLRRGLVGAV